VVKKEIKTLTKMLRSVLEARIELHINFDLASSSMKKACSLAKRKAEKE